MNVGHRGRLLTPFLISAFLGLVAGAFFTLGLGIASSRAERSASPLRGTIFGAIGGLIVSASTYTSGFLIMGVPQFFNYLIPALGFGAVGSVTGFTICPVAARKELPPAWEQHFQKRCYPASANYATRSLVWFGGHFGAEIQVAHASSTIPSVITPGGPTPPTSAHVLLATAQARYVVSCSPEGPRVWLGAGPGIVRHGGDAYAPYDSPTHLAATVSLGSRVAVTSHLHATVGVDRLFYTFDLPLPPPLQENPGRLGHGFRSDALLHVGLSWTLGGNRSGATDSA